MKVAVFDMLGREVALLVDEEKEAGYHEAEFRGQRSEVGMPIGVYFCRMRAERFTMTKRLVLMK